MATTFSGYSNWETFEVAMHVTNEHGYYEGITEMIEEHIDTESEPSWNVVLKNIVIYLEESLFEYEEITNSLIESFIYTSIKEVRLKEVASYYEEDFYSRLVDKKA